MHTIRRRPFAQGQILLLSLVFLGIFLAVSTAFLGLVTEYTKSGRYTVASVQARALAEAGIDEAIYQLNHNASYTGETDTALEPGTFSVTISTIDASSKQITTIGYIPNSTNPTATKTIKVNVGIDNSSISFHYGIQSGQGGFSLTSNNSTVYGNVYSDGTVIGSGSSMIHGDVISASADGLVYGIHASGSIYSHTIGMVNKTTTTDKDAYYVTKISTTVTGTSHSNSPDQPTVSLPISDDQISQWETQATDGGTATCSGGSYNISSGSVSIGPKKIPCDLTISGNSVVTIVGHIWVTGKITIQNNAIVKMASSLGATNVAIIADNPSDQINSSIITIKNNAAFQNSGTTGSFVFLISQNKSAESGGSVKAIDLQNNSTSLVAYAAHGLIPLSNNTALKEVTAYTISLKDNSSVTYDIGLPSVAFESGPGGSWTFVPGSYSISQ